MINNTANMVKKYKFIIISSILSWLVIVLFIFIFLYTLVCESPMIVHLMVGWLLTLALVVFLFLFRLKIKFDKKFQKILLKDCEVNEYFKIYEELYRSKLLLKQNYYYGIGCLNYLKGNFVEALECLNIVTRFPDAGYYKATSYLFLNDTQSFIREGTKALDIKDIQAAYRIRRKLKIMNKVFVLKKDCYTEINDLKIIGEIGKIEKKYLLAINNLNTGNEQEAMEILKYLSALDYDLFYVKDSLTRLKELNIVKNSDSNQDRGMS